MASGTFGRTELLQTSSCSFKLFDCSPPTRLVKNALACDPIFNESKFYQIIMIKTAYLDPAIFALSCLIIKTKQIVTVVRFH